MMDSYTRRVLIAVGIVVALLILLYFVRHVAQALLLIFAGILLAVFLSGIAQFLSRHTPLPRSLALTLAVVLIAGFLAGAGWVAGPRIAEQLSQLTERIPTSVEKMRATLSQYAWGERLLGRMSPGQGQGSLLSGTNVLGRITGVFSTALGVLTNALVILVIGLFLAINPGTYLNGIAYLFPKEKRDRVREVLALEGQGLRWWLVGRLSSMLVVGVLTGLGLWLIGMPLIFTLALLAGLLSFVPYVGPILSAIPAVLVAFTAGPGQVGAVLLVYLGVQVLESNAITPLIQQRAVSLPPALLVIAQLLMGILGGVVGVLVATPLTLALIILVQTVYVEDVLGDSVEVMGS